MIAYLNNIHDWLNQPGYMALFSISLLASSIVPIGSEWLMVIMLVKGYDPFATIAVATAGNYFGAVTTYFVGMYGGNFVVQKLFRISEKQHLQAESYYKKYGVYSLLFSWLPVIGDPLCLVAGVLKIKFYTFTLFVASGKLIRYAVTAWITLNISG